MQQKIVAREQERDSGTRRSQNEAAEARKAAQAQVAQAEQTRQQYEGKLKSVVEVLEKEQLRDFPEIRSVADLEKMSTDMMRLVETDPLESLKLQARLRAWDTHQQKLAAAHQDLKQADERKVQTARSDWMKFVQEENAKAAEHIPDLADKAKAADLTNKAATKLRDVGFTDEELQGFEKGEKVSLFDHRVQRLLFDAVRYTVAKVAPKPVAKVVPPVQRPGVTQPRSSEASVRIQTLDKQFNNSGKVDDAVALLLARRNARARAS
jgi:hypothetical protein